MEQLMSRKAAFDAALEFAERAQNLPENVSIGHVLSDAADIHAFFTNSDVPMVRTATEEAIVDVIDQVIDAAPSAEVVAFPAPAAEPTQTVTEDPEPAAEVQAEPEVDPEPPRKARQPRQKKPAKKARATRKTRGNGHADGSGEAEQVSEPSPAATMERVFQAQPEAPALPETGAQETAPMAA